VRKQKEHKSFESLEEAKEFLLGLQIHRAEKKRIMFHNLVIGIDGITTVVIKRFIYKR